MIEDANNPNRRYTFPCGQWLAEDEGDGQLFKILYPVGKSKAQEFQAARKGQYDNEEAGMLHII